jgi:L-threonylcarbamoyladenylate synthase
MLNISKSDYKTAAKILQNGGIVAFPTETVFGLGCISNSEEAFNRLVNVKKRPPNKPFTLMCSSIEQVQDIIEITPKIKSIIKKFMPGPLTIIVKTKSTVPHYLDLGTGFVGIRIPDSQFVINMINEVGVPLLVPSCNPSDLAPATSSKEAIEYFNGIIDGVVFGESQSNIPSTVCKIDGDKIVVLRVGPISLKDLEEA